MKLAEFLCADPVAREHFFTLAAATVWPRLLRAVEEELEKRGLRNHPI